MKKFKKILSYSFMILPITILPTITTFVNNSSQNTTQNHNEIRSFNNSGWLTSSNDETLINCLWNSFDFVSKKVNEINRSIKITSGEYKSYSSPIGPVSPIYSDKNQYSDYYGLKKENLVKISSISQANSSTIAVTPYGTVSFGFFENKPYLFITSYTDEKTYYLDLSSAYKNVDLSMISYPTSISYFQKSTLKKKLYETANNTPFILLLIPNKIADNEYNGARLISVSLDNLVSSNVFSKDVTNDFDSKTNWSLLRIINNFNPTANAQENYLLNNSTNTFGIFSQGFCLDKNDITLYSQKEKAWPIRIYKYVNQSIKSNQKPIFIREDIYSNEIFGPSYGDRQHLTQSQSLISAKIVSIGFKTYFYLLLANNIKEAKKEFDFNKENYGSISLHQYELTSNYNYNEFMEFTKIKEYQPYHSFLWYGVNSDKKNNDFSSYNYMPSDINLKFNYKTNNLEFFILNNITPSNPTFSYTSQKINLSKANDYVFNKINNKDTKICYDFYRNPYNEIRFYELGSKNSDRIINFKTNFIYISPFDNCFYLRPYAINSDDLKNEKKYENNFFAVLNPSPKNKILSNSITKKDFYKYFFTKINVSTNKKLNNINQWISPLWPETNLYESNHVVAGIDSVKKYSFAKLSNQKLNLNKNTMLNLSNFDSKNNFYVVESKLTKNEVTIESTKSLLDKFLINSHELTKTWTSDINFEHADFIDGNPNSGYVLLKYHIKGIYEKGKYYDQKIKTYSIKLILFNPEKVNIFSIKQKSSFFDKLPFEVKIDYSNYDEYLEIIGINDDKQKPKITNFKICSIDNFAGTISVSFDTPNGAYSDPFKVDKTKFNHKFTITGFNKIKKGTYTDIKLKKEFINSPLKIFLITKVHLNFAPINSIFELTSPQIMFLNKENNYQLSPKKISHITKYLIKSQDKNKIVFSLFIKNYIDKSGNLVKEGNSEISVHDFEVKLDNPKVTSDVKKTDSSLTNIIIGVSSLLSILIAVLIIFLVIQKYKKIKMKRNKKF